MPKCRNPICRSVDLYCDIYTRVSPSEKSLIRMLGAMFSEMDKNWTARRWFKEDSTAKAASPAKSAVPVPSCGGHR